MAQERKPQLDCGGGGEPPPPPPPKGSGLDLVGLTKVFPGGTVAVDDVNLHVDHGEYVVLLGPVRAAARRRRCA